MALDYQRFSPHLPPVTASPSNLAFAALTKDLLLLLLMVSTGVALLFNRPPIRPPSRFKHVVIPVAMSYYFVLYGVIDRLPFSLGANLIPPPLQGLAAGAGLGLSALGYLLAIWALRHLGRSFAILVSVRKVVSSGPYAYVRHPIYLGYLLDLGGLQLASGSIAMLVLGAGFGLFLIVRARLEEEMLCATDASYRESTHRRGFLFPRLATFRHRAASRR